MWFSDVAFDFDVGLMFGAIEKLNGNENKEAAVAVLVQRHSGSEGRRMRGIIEHMPQDK